MVKEHSKADALLFRCFGGCDVLSKTINIELTWPMQMLSGKVVME